MAEIPSYIHPEINKEILIKELSEDKFIRKTNKLDNEIYIVNQHNSPNVVKEIGRLRELTFSNSGGGTGKSLDLDNYDLSNNCYNQLIVWSPTDKEIIGGYRFIDCSSFCGKKLELSTTHYFNFKETFIKDYLSETIELGRSWIRPEYQPTVNPKKGIFALDNLWDGLGAIIKLNPQTKYLFGKVTMYSDYNKVAKDALLYFMHKYFPDKDKMVIPIESVNETTDINEFKTSLENKNFKEGYRLLKAFIRSNKEMIPPLINSYMQLSSTMKTFGTALNSDFGNVDETGILVIIKDIKEETLNRYTNF